MVFLDPIHPFVQQTLLEKMRMSGKQSTRVSEPMSKGDGSNLNPLGKAGNVDLAYLSARTIWARMFSLTVPKKTNMLASVIAGEVIEDYKDDLLERVKEYGWTLNPATGKLQKITK